MCSSHGPGGSPMTYSQLPEPPRGYLPWLPKPLLVSLVTAERRAKSTPLLASHCEPQRQGGLDNS